MEARLVARHAQRAVEEALADTRVVVVLGARQVGKSTLLEQVASTEGAGREILTFDNQAVRAAATTDPPASSQGSGRRSRSTRCSASRR